MDAAPPLWASLSKLLGPDKDVANHPWAGVRVLLRLDLNLPLSSDGAVTDRSRLDAALPGLELLLGKGARVAVATHFGRPQPGAESHAEMEARDGLAPVAGLLRAALGAAFVGAASDVAGPSAAALVASLANGQACLLQNVRFEAGETAAEGSPAFAALSQRLAALCDAFVLDGFGVCHRAQASVTGVARLVPLRLPGPLVRRELAAFAACLSAPARPFVVLLGGAKVADKLGVVSALLRVADVVLVGGKMAFTFLAARGVAVGATQVEAGSLEAARAASDQAARGGARLLLPCDVLVSDSPGAALNERVVPLTPDCCSPAVPCLPAGAFGVDVGPASRHAFAAHIAAARTVLWNGPVGKFEVPAFGGGTAAMARALAAAFASGATAVAAGGDTLAALHAAGAAGGVTHASTGGGASLQLLEGQSMPGLEALL